MKRAPLNHFEPVLKLNAGPMPYGISGWELRGTFAKYPDLESISDRDYMQYDNVAGFGPDAKLDLNHLELSAYIDVTGGEPPRIYAFSCDYASPYSVKLDYAERMLRTLRHIQTVRNGYEQKGFYAHTVEDAMLQTLDAIGCTRLACPVDGYGQRGGSYEVSGLAPLNYQLKKIVRAFSEAQGIAVA